MDVLNSATDDISLRTRDNVRDTVSGIDDSSGKGTVGNAVRGPGRREGEHRLDGDVQTLDVEGFEEDFGGLFPVLGWVQGRLGLYVRCLVRVSAAGRSRCN